MDSKVSTCYWLNKDWVRLGFGAEFLFGRRCVDVDESGGGSKYDEGNGIPRGDLARVPCAEFLALAEIAQVKDGGFSSAMRSPIIAA